jgi:hypothetical protein
MSTNITDRAAIVLQEIDAALEMAEKATPGPWYQGCDLNSAVFDRQGRDIVPDCDPDDAAFIATSRTLLPASMRCLKTAIEGLLKTIKPFRFPDEDRPEAHDALTTLCDQWRAAQ